MKASAIVAGAAAGVVVLLAVVGGYRAMMSRPIAPPDAEQQVTHPSLIYGRVTTVDGATYEGRLRWGSSGEALWGNYFSGVKRENPWLVQMPPEAIPEVDDSIRIFGLKLIERSKPMTFERLLMTRFGDIRRLEAQGRDILLTLKSGTAFKLDLYSASDFDDGVVVWDRRGGVTGLNSVQIRTIDFLPSPPTSTDPNLLYGTVHTRQGDFTGFIQWDREQCLGSDRLDDLRFDMIRSIVKRSDGFHMTLLDGREIMLSRDDGTRGVYIDDLRYGRVLVSWDAFDSVDFAAGRNGPGFEDYPPGESLRGSVTTRGGRRLQGRLILDLDESETTDTLDAPSKGVNYTIPFGLVAAFVLPSGSERARVTLHSREVLELERSGDLSAGNAGVLIFGAQEHPTFVAWADVEQIGFDPPRAMYPPIENRESR